MKQFETSLNEYHKELSNVDVNPIDNSDFIIDMGELLHEKWGEESRFNPKNVYYLKGGEHSLPKLRANLDVDNASVKLKPLRKQYEQKEEYYVREIKKAQDLVRNTPGASTNPSDPASMALETLETEHAQFEDDKKQALASFDDDGSINNEEVLSITLYNAFENAITISNKNFINISELLTATLRARQRYKVEISETIPNINQKQAHEALLNYLKRENVDDDILYLKYSNAQKRQKRDDETFGEGFTRVMSKFLSPLKQDYETIKGDLTKSTATL